MTLRIEATGQRRELRLGLDAQAKVGLDTWDQLLPPTVPLAKQLVASLKREPVGYALSTDVQPLSEEVRWRIQLSSPEPVQLTIDSQDIPAGRELVISEGQMETVLSVSPEMQLDSGERELMITLRRLPKVTQLLQNYPNPLIQKPGDLSS